MLRTLRDKLKCTSGVLLTVGVSGLLLFIAGCQSNDQLSPSPASGDNTPSPPGETAGRDAQPSPFPEKSFGSDGGAVADATGSADYPRFIQLPIFISDHEIVPNEIELWLGQSVVLDIFNVGSRTQAFVIGRDTVYENGVPAGFEEDFFQGGFSIDSALGDVRLFELADPSREGYAGNYRGVMALLPTDYVRFLVQKQHERFQRWWVDNSPGPYLFGTYTLASLEFRITREMLGEWTYTSFAEDGKFYDKGVRGHLVVRSAFDLP